jgi:hypothetical protein
MKFLDRFENAKRVWELALPTVPMPSNQTLIGWLAVYRDDEYESAVVRTPHRLSQGSMGRGIVIPDNVYRLVSSLLHGERARREEKGVAAQSALEVKSDEAPQSKRKEEQWNA